MKTPKDEVLVTAYLVRFALTTGILRVRGRYCPTEPRPVLSYLTPNAGFTAYAHHGQWFLTQKEAEAVAAGLLARAKSAAQRKLDSLNAVKSFAVVDHTGGHP